MFPPVENCIITQITIGSKMTDDFSLIKICAIMPLANTMFYISLKISWLCNKALSCFAYTAMD